MFMYLYKKNLTIDLRLNNYIPILSLLAVNMDISLQLDINRTNGVIKWHLPLIPIFNHKTNSNL